MITVDRAMENIEDMLIAQDIEDVVFRISESHDANWTGICLCWKRGHSSKRK